MRYIIIKLSSVSECGRADAILQNRHLLCLLLLLARQKESVLQGKKEAHRKNPVC